MSNRPFKTFTFKSTGVTVIVPPVSVINLQNKFMRNYPPPPPPMVEVDMGDGVELQENTSDPAWIEELKNHQNEIGLKVMQAVNLRVAFRQVLTDDQKKEVESFRQMIGDTEELPDDDRLLWFDEIASGDDVELGELAQFASGLGDPQAEGVNLEVNNFRSAVQK